MRVLIVTNMYPTPGVPHGGTFVAAQVESLRALAVEIEVWHLRRQEEGRGVYRGLAQKVRRIVAAHEPDLVHVQYGGVLASRISGAVRDRPVLVSFCGDDLLGSPGAGLLDFVAGRVNVVASRRAAARAAGIVVKSRNLYDALPRSVDRETVWILPNGVDLSRFRPMDNRECQRRLGWDVEHRHVLFPAPPNRSEKRFPLAEAAVAELDGATGRTELHSLSGIEHADVPIWLNAADVVLLTSSREGSPNAIKEALACNVPVVSVDVGDVAERLEGIAGCYLAEATPEDLARKLRHVLERPGRVDGQARMSELGIERVAARLRDIYQMLVM
jgi:teichuronic acid biosynthesis glycosyltransferase TuaC